MGILQVTKEATQRQLYTGILGRFVPRGISIPLDPFAKGRIRFGRKVEFLLPLLALQNRYQLDEDAVFDTDRIVLNLEPPWMTTGGFIYVGERELHEIEDVVDDTVILTTKLRADHPTNEPVYHYSNPVVVEGNYVAGVEVINIDTEYFIVRGDHIAISSRADISLSFKEYVVEDYSLIGTVGGINQYQVTLDRPIHRALSDAEVIQLRAFMAYKSQIVPVPVQAGAVRRVVGPFLIDWVSAPFVNGLEVQERQTIQRFNDARIPLGPPEQIDKNRLILNTPIRADQFLWWDVIDGEVNYDNSSQRFIFFPDDEGKALINFDCIPKVTVPFTYASGSMITTEKSTLSNNEWFRIDDSENARVFEYQVDGTYVPTPQNAATGSIVVSSVPTANNQWFAVNDGFGTTQYFEYKIDATFVPTPNYVVIDVSSAVFPLDVAVLTEAAVNGASVQVTASRPGPTTTLVFTNDTISLKGNQPLLIDGTLGWLTTGMSGGTDPVTTIDISTITTDVEVAAYTSAAINQANLKISADNPGIFNSFKMFSQVPGVAGNIPITEGIGDANFIIQGMTGGTGGMQWHFQVNPTQDVLMRIQLYPNDWADFNLTAGVDNTIVVPLASTDEDVEKINILVKAPAADAEVAMTDWNISTPNIAAISSEYVLQMIGDYNVAATPIWAKPYFFSLDDVRFKLDDQGNLDSGLVRV